MKGLKRTWEETTLATVSTNTGPPAFIYLFYLFDQFAFNETHLIVFLCLIRW